MGSIGRRDRARHDNGSRRNTTVRNLASRSVQNTRALSDVYPHREHRVALNDHSLDDLTAGPDETVILDDGRRCLKRLQNATNANPAGQMYILPNLGARPNGCPRVDHRTLVDIGSDIHIARH